MIHRIAFALVAMVAIVTFAPSADAAPRHHATKASLHKTHVLKPRPIVAPKPVRPPVVKPVSAPTVEAPVVQAPVLAVPVVKSIPQAKPGRIDLSGYCVTPPIGPIVIVQPPNCIPPHGPR